MRLVTVWLLAIPLVGSWAAPVSATTEDVLCSVPPRSYAAAKQEHADYAFALNELEKRGIASWYSDRETNGQASVLVQEMVDVCDPSTRLSVVVYGLPNKDCEAGYSATNSQVQTAEDYALFIDTLTTIVGTRKVLYVLEPDAVGLIANGGCALESGYTENLLVAIDKLTDGNEHAEIYLDVGFWTLFEPEKAAAVAQVVKELVLAAGRGQVKGITLNTSNYRPTKEMVSLCGKFQDAYNSTELHCIIDTSRNNNEASSEEWCNRRGSGIGHPPTSDTGIDYIDYFVWIKPPGESDGECDGVDHTPDAMVGPEAGLFFPDMFELLWNNGYLHQVETMPGINLSVSMSKTHVIIAVLCGVAAVAIAFIALIVVYRRRAKVVGEPRSRAYFA